MGVREGGISGRVRLRQQPSPGAMGGRRLDGRRREQGGGNQFAGSVLLSDGQRQALLANAFGFVGEITKLGIAPSQPTLGA